MNNNQLLNQFLKEIQLEGRSIQSIRNLRCRIPKLFDYINENSLDIKYFRAREAIGYQGWLIETGRFDGGRYSTRTLLSYLTAASSFFDFLKSRNLIYSNPFKEIKYIRAEKTLPRDILKENQISRLLSYFADYQNRANLKQKIRAYRMHVLTELLYSTGLRISETANLKVDDIDFDSSIIKVREGKGGLSRIAVLNDYVRNILYLYVTEMRELIQTSWHDPQLLFGTSWERFGKWANKALKEATAELDLPPVTCHGIRHALGFHLLRSGCPLRSIQTILGHKRIRNTEIYTKVEKEDLKKVLDQYHPRQWRLSA